LSVSPQKSPLVTEPVTALFPTMWAVSSMSPFWLLSSLMRKSAAVVFGKVNRPMALCGVSANCEVIVSGRLLSAE
jgi:hypothetical protein